MTFSRKRRPSVPNTNAAKASALLKDESGFEHQPSSSRLAAAQALAFVAIAEELARANDLREQEALRA